MKILYRRCAGLDVHQKPISACIRIRVDGHKVEAKTTVFGTVTHELERLREWLKEHRVKHVAMESTGVYWIPVWNVLELVRYRFELMVVPPQQVRALQGCKTDRIDVGDPEKLAGYKVGKLKCTHEELVRALDGRFNDHFRWLLRDVLDKLAYLDRKLAELEARTRAHIEPYMPAMRRLCTIPGVDDTTACAIIAEIGVDMSVFPTSGHVASWAGLCPGNNESGGKRLSGRTRKGSRYLRRLLIQNAWAVAHMKDCGLTAAFHKIAARRGPRKAAMAIAHRILLIAYYILRDGAEYKDPGGNYLDRRDPARTAKRLLARLERIGLTIDPQLLALAGRLPRHPNSPRPPIPAGAGQRLPVVRQAGPRLHTREEPQTRRRS